MHPKPIEDTFTRITFVGNGRFVKPNWLYMSPEHELVPMIGMVPAIMDRMGADGGRFVASWSGHYKNLKE